MIAGSVGRGKDNSRHKQTIDLATPFDVAALEAPILFKIRLSPPPPSSHILWAGVDSHAAEDKPEL